MKEKKTSGSGCCHLFFGEWQAVRPECLKFLTSIYPDLSEGEITMLHGEEATESRVLESLKTRDLFSTRTVVIYQEPDFLQRRGGKKDRAARLQRAMDDNRPERAARILAAMMREGKVSVADLQSGNRAVLKRLGLPDEVDFPRISEILEKFSGKIEEALHEASGPGGERILEWTRHGFGKGISPQAFLIIHLERPDRKNRILKKFLDSCPVTDLTGHGEKYGKKTASIKARVRAWLSQQGKEIEPQALGFFVEKVGEGSLSALKNEAEKLASLTGGRKKITLEDARKLVVRHHEEEIFKVTEAFRSRNLSKVLASSRMLLEQGIHPLAVLSAIRNLVIKILALKVAARASGLEGRLGNVRYPEFRNTYWKQLKEVLDRHENSPLDGLHPYGAYLNLAALNRFSWEELLDMLEEMPDLDFSLKGGKTAPELVLESFFLRRL